MLTPDELAGMRNTVESAFPDSVFLGRAVANDDGAGGQSEVWTFLLEPTPCRVMPAGGAETTVAEALRAQADYVVHVPRGTDVAAGDRFGWGDDHLEVLAVADGGEWATEMTITCKRVA